MQVLDRFLHYVTFDTTADPTSSTVPSTPHQMVFAHHLVTELKTLGVPMVTLSPQGVIYALIPSNVTQPTPTVGFIAHIDTSFDCSGHNVKPSIIHNYDGRAIILNNDKMIISDPDVLPSLQKQLGKTLVVTDGTTLLGADNKAGVAAIMDIAAYYMQNPGVPHGNIAIAFTPDEEIGRGTDHFDLAYFQADFAYTVDGSSANEIEYENFYAAQCDIEIKGLSTHPGAAKNVMINSQHLAFLFHQQLPAELDPAKTSGYEGFNHLIAMKGSVEQSQLTYIIRNHDFALFEQQKQRFYQIQASLNQQYNQPLISLTIQDTYHNMKDLILQKPLVLNLAKKAIEANGLTPKSSPIRGGTDGARLTYMGLPCPNLGTGGYHFHGPNEYLVVEELQQVVSILKSIITFTMAEKKEEFTL